MNACISACQNFDKRTHKGLERKRKERLGTHTRVEKRIRDLCKVVFVEIDDAFLHKTSNGCALYKSRENT